MIKLFCLLISLCTCLCILRQSLTLSLGSNTTGSRQSLPTFPATDTDNTMLGFGAFEKGFRLASNVTTCTFNSFFPIAGDITMNGGALYLLQDLVISTSCRWMSAGRFYGNAHSIELGELGNVIDFQAFPDVSVLGLPQNFLFNNVNLVFHGNVRFYSPVYFQGNCKIDGRGKRLGIQVFRPAAIIVRPRSTLTIENVKIRGVSNNCIRCMTDDASIIINNSILNLFGDYTFSCGSILFDQNVMITGTSKFNYTSGLTSTIGTGSVLYFGLGTTFSYNPRLAKQNLLYMTDNTSSLYLDGSTLHSTRTGLRLSTGNLIIDDSVTFSSEARYLAEAMALSSGLSAKILNGGSLDLQGLIRYD